MRPLLLDEMLSPRLAESLRERDVDAVALVADAGLRGIPDDEVRALATEQGRVVVTCNVADFLRLDVSWRAEGRSHSGLALIASASFPQDKAFVGAVTDALVAAGPQLLPDTVTFVRRVSAGGRPLPRRS